MENKRFWGEFIENYREHPCLWDVKSKEYSNKLLKNKSYTVLLKKIQEIAPHADINYVKKKLII